MQPRGVNDLVPYVGDTEEVLPSEHPDCAQGPGLIKDNDHAGGVRDDRLRLSAYLLTCCKRPCQVSEVAVRVRWADRQGMPSTHRMNHSPLFGVAAPH